jgi:hypothetical protein
MIRGLARNLSSLMTFFVVLPCCAQYSPIGKFFYTLPNGTDFTAAGPDGGVDSILTGRAIAEFERENAVRGLQVAAFVDAHFFLPIQNSLVNVQQAQLGSDLQGAKIAATSAAETWNNLWNSKLLGATASFLEMTGSNQTIATFATDFFNYVEGLQESVKSAMRVPDGIDEYLKNNYAGIKLYNRASIYNGTFYSLMTCDQLISKAAEDAGDKIVTAPGGPTVTKSWFAHGMGPDFPQIAGGTSGITLGQLVHDETTGNINLPIGSVIVSDGGTSAHGHAALFVGEVTVDNHTRLVLYDANDYKAFQISVEGESSPGDPDDVTMLAFPGHQVGEHVTHLQWGDSHLVKVFKPIGNRNPTGGSFDDQPGWVHGPPMGPIPLPSGTPNPSYLTLDTPPALNQPVVCGQRNPGVIVPFSTAPCGRPPQRLPLRH